MKAKIVRIGNSQGVRLPKFLLEETQLPNDVEITVEGNRLVIAPARQPREGWAEAFARMAANGDDKMILDGSMSNKFDEEEWEW